MMYKVEPRESGRKTPENGKTPSVYLFSDEYNPSTVPSLTCFTSTKVRILVLLIQKDKH